jgi:flagellin-like protein
MKGVSAVIATILMLMITIALAGTAYMYISGVFTARTGVVLSISDSLCNTTYIKAFVRNDGTATSGAVNLYVDGIPVVCAVPVISSIDAGTEASCQLPRDGGGTGSGTVGYHNLRAETTGASARGNVYCGSTSP